MSRNYQLAVGGVVLGGTIYTAYQTSILFLLVALLMVGLGLLGWWGYRRFRARRTSQKLSDGIRSQSTLVPRSISDPNQRKKLDDLRKTFGEGLERVLNEGRKKGIDYLNRHPWLLIIGEPGAGKTSIVKHSEMGIRDRGGKESEGLKGAGGTINMNWFFTDKAVIIDTAGRILFEEVTPGKNNEWTEFLRLLSKSRRLTPINGLLLVVSADTLLAEEKSTIEERALKIKERLQEIQSTLDVRFPVYLVVTKCDKISGFHPFFENMNGSAAKQQMIGWSNPASLDEPFQPEKTEEYVAEIATRLKQHRLSLLMESISKPVSARRLDDLDALYHFPTALQELGANLRIYLEKLFSAGEWSSIAPLFVRGIYFSSATFDGQVLDRELAAALRIPVTQVKPWTGVIKRDSTLFIRDLFLKKIVLERGLVTKSFRAQGMVKRRRTICAIAGVSILLIFLAVQIYSLNRLQDSIGNELALWREARSIRDNRTTMSIAVPSSRLQDPFVYRGEQKPKGRTFTPLEFQVLLEESTRDPIDVPWLARATVAMSSDVNQLRRLAQKAIFESEVISPLLTSARIRLGNPITVWTDDDSAAWRTLVQLENSIHGPGSNTRVMAEEFLQPLWQVSFPKEPLPYKLTETFKATYAKTLTLDPQWPPAQFSGGKSFKENLAIAMGVERVLRAYRDNIGQQEAALPRIRRIFVQLSDLRKVEDSLPNIALTKALDDPLKQWQRVIDEYSAAVTAVQNALRDAVSAEVLPTENQMLRPAYDRQAQRARQITEGIAQVLQSSIQEDSANVTGSRSSDYKIPAEIKERLASAQQLTKAKIDDIFSSKELVEMIVFDERFLARNAAGIPLMVAHSQMLTELMKTIGQPTNASDNLVGRLADVLLIPRTEPAKPGATPVIRDPIDPIERARRDLIFDLYFARTQAFLKAGMGFPVLRDDRETSLSDAQLVQLNIAIAKIEKDIASSSQYIVSSRHRDLERRITRALTTIKPVMKALVNGEASRLNRVTVRLAGQEVHSDLLGDGFSSAYAGWTWRLLKANNKPFSTDDPKTAELGTFPLSSSELQIDLYRYRDDPRRDAGPFYLLGDWQIIKWLRESRTKRLDGGRQWTVYSNYKDGELEKTLIFQLEFESKFDFPLLEDWPTRAMIDL